MVSLKSTALSGMVWTFAEQFGNQIINFLVTVILSRLLLPSDFGLIAMFSIFIVVAGTITDGGLGSSLVRTENPDQGDFSTVFVFSLLVSILLYLLLFFSAPAISDFYSYPILTKLIRVYGISLLIAPFSAIPRIMMIKKLDFKTQFKIQLPSLILSGVFGVIFAVMGFGVWSLVYSQLIKTSVSTLQFIFYSKWKPSLIFDKEKFRYHFNFGYKMTLSSLLNVIFNNLYSLIIGKFFSANILGFYNRADTLKQLPISNLSTALNRVTFPLFAHISHDDDRLKDVYQKLMKIVILVTAPVMIFLIVVAKPMIVLLLTEKWLPSVPYFQVLALAAILYPIHSYNLNILQVKGRSDLFLKLEIIKKVFLVFILWVSIKYGIYGLLWGQVFFSVLSFFINTHYSGKILQYQTFEQLLDLLPSLVFAVVLGFILFLLNKYYLNVLPGILVLLINFIIFVFLFFVGSKIFFDKELNFLFSTIKTIKKKPNA